MFEELLLKIYYFLDKKLFIDSSREYLEGQIEDLEQEKYHLERQLEDKDFEIENLEERLSSYERYI